MTKKTSRAARPEASTGHIELERRIDSIVVGSRHRKDPGDIDELAASIGRLGLLQPITLTPDGHLVCGWRRLLALQRLGWRTTNVWVRSGVSDQLSGLLAQQDDDALHKPLSQLEAAALYRELKRVMTEDAARRQAATRFGRAALRPDDHDNPADTEDSLVTCDASTTNERCARTPMHDVLSPSPGGNVLPGAESAPPRQSSPDERKTRRQAAEMVTGRASYSRLEQIGAIQDIAADPDQPAVIREIATLELASVDRGAAVDPAYQRVRAAMRLVDATADNTGTSTHGGTRANDSSESDLIAAAADGVEELHRLATAAVTRATSRTTHGRAAHNLASPSGADEPSSMPRSGHRPSVRSFALTWADLDGWIAGYDPSEVAAVLGETDWTRFERVLAEVNAFAAAARAARAAHPLVTQVPVTA